MSFDPCETRELGETGAFLTQMGFGGGPIGELFERIGDDQAHATLEAAWQAGLRYFDTAPWYGRGLSELRCGRFLRSQPRGLFTLSTKVGRVFKRPSRPRDFETGFWAGGLHFDHDFDYSYDGVMRAVEQSMMRLGLNEIDLLLIHDLDSTHHPTEPLIAAYLAQLATGGWRALEGLRSTGAIKGIGAGINQLGMIPRFLDMMDLDFFLYASRYTLLDQRSLEVELPRCEAQGVGLIIGGVFNSGILATGAVSGAKYDYEDAPPEIMEKVARIQAVCEAHHVSLPAAALQFPLAHPSVTSVIPGASSPQQVTANVEALRAPIPPALWDDLKSSELLHPAAPVPQ